MSGKAKVYRWRWWLLAAATVTLLPLPVYLFVALTPDAPEPEAPELALRQGSAATQAGSDALPLGEQVAGVTGLLQVASADFTSDELAVIQEWLHGDFANWDAGLAGRYLEANADTFAAFDALTMAERPRFASDTALLDPRDTDALFALTGVQRLKVSHAVRTDRGETAFVESSRLGLWTTTLMRAGADMVRTAAAFDAHEQAVEAMLEAVLVLNDAPGAAENWTSLVGLLGGLEQQLFQRRELFADVIRAEYHQRRLLLVAIVRGDEIAWMGPQEGQAMRTLHGAGLFKPNAAHLELIRVYRPLLERWESLAAEAVLPGKRAASPYAIPDNTPGFFELATSLNPGGLYFMRRAGAFVPNPEFLEAWRRLGTFHVRSAQIELAIRGYQTDFEGALPPDLAALVPGYLEAIPLDPFALETIPLRYDATAGQIASVGIDGEADAASFPVTLERGGDAEEREMLRRRLEEPVRVLLASPLAQSP